jgi:hypothetical protein
MLTMLQSYLEGVNSRVSDFMSGFLADGTYHGDRQGLADAVHRALDELHQAIFPRIISTYGTTILDGILFLGRDTDRTIDQRVYSEDGRAVAAAQVAVQAAPQV